MVHWTLQKCLGHSRAEVPHNLVLDHTRSDHFFLPFFFTAPPLQIGVGVLLFSLHLILVIEPFSFLI